MRCFNFADILCHFSNNFNMLVLRSKISYSIQIQNTFSKTALHTGQKWCMSYTSLCSLIYFNCMNCKRYLYRKKYDMLTYHSCTQQTAERFCITTLKRTCNTGTFSFKRPSGIFKVKSVDLNNNIFTAFCSH